MLHTLSLKYFACLDPFVFPPLDNVTTYSQMIHHCGASLSKQHMADLSWHTAGLSLSTVCGYKPNLIMHIIAS